MSNTTPSTFFIIDLLGNLTLFLRALDTTQAGTGSRITTTDRIDLAKRYPDHLTARDVWSTWVAEEWPDAIVRRGTMAHDEIQVDFEGTAREAAGMLTGLAGPKLTTYYVWRTNVEHIDSRVWVATPYVDVVPGTSRLAPTYVGKVDAETAEEAAAMACLEDASHYQEWVAKRSERLENGEDD